MRVLITIFVLIVSCHIGHGQQLAPPTVSLESGIFTFDQTVSISHPEPGVTLFYTLNGSDPTPQDFVYSGPITVSNRLGDPDNYALIPTNPSFIFPVGDYNEQRMNNRGWLAPYVNEIYKINVLRVKAYKAGFVPSETVTKTYMIDPAGATLYSMPIVSFVCDSSDLYSAASGIYRFGNHPMGNYTQKGSAWERMAYIDFFDVNGNLGFQRDVRVRIHGGGSRHAPKKTFRIYGELDTIKNFNYPFFEDYDVSKFKRILLRTGGHRPDCFPRDNMANSFTKGLNVDQQHYEHVIVFLNGEYWGIQTIKERVDKYFLQNHYEIDDNEITILDQEYDVQDGYAIDSVEMVKIETRADTSDMTNDANYQWIADRIDIANYMDYMAAEIFLSNEDWVFSNVVIWRRTGPYNPSLGPGYDGKFRWLFYDFDGAFGGSCNNAYYTVNTLENATVPSGFAGPYTRLFRGLLENPGFKENWINRTCDLMNSNFKANVLHEKLDSFYTELTPEMPDEVDRWRYPSEATTLADRQNEIPSLVQWDTSFYYLNRFADRRQRKVREHIMLKWGYPDTAKITLDVNDASMGSVQINTILVNEQLPGVDAVVYPWQGMYIDSVNTTLIAVPKPGYEFVEWLETGETNDTVNWLPVSDTLYTAIFQASADYQPVVINELMASNKNYMDDPGGDSEDWIELYNPNAYPINLSACTLELGLNSWTIPNGTVIEADGYLIFWCDNEVHQGNDHVSFKLPNANNTNLYLYDPSGNMMDFVTYPQNTTDYSWGRSPNGSNTFAVFSTPTPWLNNDLASVEGPQVYISDITAYPNPTEGYLRLNKLCDFSLYSMDGRLIDSYYQTDQIDISHLPNGTYLIRTTEGSSVKIILKK